MSFLMSMFNHGSQFDADQLLNIFFPFSKNPEYEEGRICIFQPGQKYIPFALSLLKYIYAMSKRMNKIMRDTAEQANHMDLCQGKALFEALKSYNTDTMKGRNKIYKLLFDKKTGVIGGIPWIRVAVEKPTAGPGGAKEEGRRVRLWSPWTSLSGTAPIRINIQNLDVEFH